MRRVTKAYQALQDRNNPDEVESHGPYKCERADAWVGEGYYFWETFIDNAHWWGKSHYDEYIICEAEFDFDDDRCFDLAGNTQHMQEFQQILTLLKEQGLIDSNTSIGRVIRYLQNRNLFQYEACRVTSPQSRRLNSDHNKPTPIGKGNNSYTVHLQPPFQICFYSSHSLNLRNYKVIYPEQYREGYGV